jgi:hypothetical protein
MEAHSRAWMVRCSCGFERSVWEMGGIRWNAGRGRPRWFAECPQCGRRSWHTDVRSGPNPKLPSNQTGQE